MPFDSGDGERISRFLTDRKQYSPTKNVVRHTAFMPPKTLRHSVYWTTDVSDGEIWAIGDQFVAPHRGAILGRADVNSLVIYYVVGLKIDLDGQPHPKHANIIGWDADEKKIRHQAEKLADKATLILRAA